MKKRIKIRDLLTCAFCFLIASGCADMNLPQFVIDSPSYHYIHFDVDSVLSRTYKGYKDLERRDLVDQNTSFHAFSITKTFTAVAVMQLVEEGKLNLDNHVDSYIPSYQFSKAITIRQLLCHQSGLPNPIPMSWIHLAKQNQSSNFSMFADSLVMKYLSNKKDPGKAYKYSNLNYLILGRLIEKVAGMDFQDYINTHIVSQLDSGSAMGFEYPLQSHATGYHKNSFFQKLILKFLMDSSKHLYAVNDSFLGFRPFVVNGSSYGGLFCTPDDLVAFARALLKSESPLLSSGSINEMFTDQHIKGEPSQMSLGWFTGSHKGNRYLHHSGGGGGYYAELRIYPDLGVGSVIMMNHSGMRDMRILDSMDSFIVNADN